MTANVSKIETIFSEATLILDHLGRPAINGRLYSSVAWSMGARIINCLSFMSELNKSMDFIAERDEGDEDKIRENQKGILTEMNRQEKILGEAKSMFAYAAENTYLGGADAEKIVTLIGKHQDIQPEDAIDLEGLQEDVAAGDLTQAEANAEIAKAVVEQMEKNETREKWMADQHNHLIGELESAKKIKLTDDFEISDQMYLAVMNKISDKIDDIIKDNGVMIRKTSTTRRRKINAQANKSLLKSLLAHADNFVIQASRETEGAGYPVEEGGVH